MEPVGIHTCVQQCDPELALTHLHVDVVLNHFVSLLCKQSGLFPPAYAGGLRVFQQSQDCSVGKVKPHLLLAMRVHMTFCCCSAVIM